MEEPPYFDKLLEADPNLKEYENDLILRWNKMAELESAFSAEKGGLAEFAESYKNYGIVQMENGNVEVFWRYMYLSDKNDCASDISNCLRISIKNTLYLYEM